MSLLLNDDFSTYQLRLAYLQHIHDGVGERLINLNTAVLNNPAFRAAGWTPDTAATKRCYSPPIPTAGAGLSNEYFQAPRRAARVNLEDEGEKRPGGMVTGHQGSEDTIGAGALGVTERRRRQRSRKEQLDEEDSSDLSDDSEEEERTAAQGITFNKMSVRRRSRNSQDDTLKAELENDGPALMVTSPSRPPENVTQALRRGSLGQVEAVKQRARRDTATSSDISSENELDPNSAFNRKLPGRPGGKKTVLLTERVQEEEQRDVNADAEIADSDLEDENVGEASDLSDEFEVDGEASASPNLLGIGIGGVSDDTSSPIKPPPNMPPAITPQNQSPRKASKDNMLPKLPKLPPGRPLNTKQASSLLSMALRGSDGSSSGEKSFQRFADLSGKGEASPLWIKIYAPFSETPTDPIEVPLRRTKEGQPVTVAELIGLALWRYNEEEFEPSVTSEQDANTNRWDLRIVEDEEVDFDFPALVRTKPVTDFTSNNNRPPQRRARDKPWDEFGLVRATEEQFMENEATTPQIGMAGTPIPAPAGPGTPRVEEPATRPAPAQRMESEATITNGRSTPVPGFNDPPRNPITGPTFATTASRKDTGNLLDMPQRDTTQSTPRTGAPKTVTVHFTDPQNFSSSTIAIPTTADTYIAEIFDHTCKKLNQEKALFVLKVHGTQTVAPSDRTVEALGDRLHLDLVRRRFAGADGVFGLGLSGSPGSSSPNAPLELTTITTASTSGGRRKKGTFGLPATTAKADAPNMSTTALGPDIGGSFGGKKYNVLRKQPLSFAPSHPRTLIITPEYMQVLPAAPDSLAAPTGKVTNVPMSSIIGVKVSRKHPKMVRVLVFREKETKRYDFECLNREEANLIVEDVRKGIDGVRDEGDF